MSNPINAIKVASLLGAIPFASAPSLAQTNGSGYIGVSYEIRDVEVGPVVDGDGGTLRVDGAYAFPLGSNFNLQIDAAFSRTSYDDGLGGHPLADQNALSGGIHLFYRNEHFSAGVFAGYANLWQEAGPNERKLGGGVEANAYLGPVSLGAVYARLDGRGAFGSDVDGFELTARVFPTDNLAIRAKYSYADVDFPGFDIDPRGTSLSVEYLPRSLPISFQLGATRQRISEFDVTFNSLYFGLRYQFGPQSLRQRDREGASAAMLVDLFSPR